ncbi:succinate dehydrogenase assembly factor 2 [Imbroritus primus]|jgi:antitoxin CptB|uniref:Succinate dehydrogenase assembly factor 2 n=1 Tax=Imbroritus primus TaxID=3058603 RepID=A0ACD3SPZ9_9BURK|nr:succinate dehydrogenase assembly factor 2 [Burkholderiaceae bacterium PBA]
MTEPALPGTPGFSHQSDPRRRARLRWRARRGLLENDLIIERFFNRYETELSDTDIEALDRILDLPDYELMDLLLERKQLEPPLDTPEIRKLLTQLRSV